MTDQPNPVGLKKEISWHPTDHSRKALESDIREDKTVPFWCVRAREHIEGIPHDCKALDDKPAECAISRDRELWRETEGDHYAPRLFVTAGGEIGMNVGGWVHVRSIREWHRLASEEK